MLLKAADSTHPSDSGRLLPESKLLELLCVLSRGVLSLLLGLLELVTRLGNLASALITLLLVHKVVQLPLLLLGRLLRRLSSRKELLVR